MDLQRPWAPDNVLPEALITPSALSGYHDGSRRPWAQEWEGAISRSPGACVAMLISYNDDCLFGAG